MWKLKKTGFFLSISGRIQELGCEKSLLNPVKFMFFSSQTEKEEEEREPSGLAVTHVDDILNAGGTKFDEKVINPLKESFKFGSEESLEFRYVGLNING